jgi:arginine decarboxylase
VGVQDNFRLARLCHTPTVAASDFDPEAAWNERKQIYKHSSLIIDSTSITATAVCGPDNHWTCAIAAAVFLFS